MKRITRAKAIRLKCLDCSCFDRKEVKFCPVTNCALWPYRLGKEDFSQYDGYNEPSEEGEDEE